METIDNRASLYELDEIFKYKDLITLADKEIIKQIIFKGDEKANQYHQGFIELVANEVDHQLNKDEFEPLKDSLIAEMENYLNNSN